MGLKTTNYEVKDLGITIAEAYAIIHCLEVDGDNGRAEFYIQGSRDNAFNLKPLERKIVSFKVNREESPFTTAYNTAKGTYTIKQYNAETKAQEDVEKGNIFYGWEDSDI